MDARRFRGPLLLLVLACLAGAGCGDDGDTAGTQGDATPKTRQLDVPAQAVDSPQALTAQPVDGSFQGIDFDAYNKSVDEILALLNEYWANELPKDFGTKYTPPDDVVAYYAAEGLPRCGGEKLGRENAYYCDADNTIYWDEPGLMIPFYEKVGDAAVGS